MSAWKNRMASKTFVVTSSNCLSALYNSFDQQVNIFCSKTGFPDCFCIFKTNFCHQPVVRQFLRILMSWLSPISLFRQQIWKNPDPKKWLKSSNIALNAVNYHYFMWHVARIFGTGLGHWYQNQRENFGTLISKILRCPN